MLIALARLTIHSARGFKPSWIKRLRCDLQLFQQAVAAPIRHERARGMCGHAPRITRAESAGAPPRSLESRRVRITARPTRRKRS
jgi:hypothetical protein